jgi:hypothetical protein
MNFAQTITWADGKILALKPRHQPITDATTSMKVMF